MVAQYWNDMFTLTKDTQDLRENSILERSAVPLTNYGPKFYKRYGAEIGNLLPTSYEMGVSFDTFKNMITTWPGPTCKCLLFAYNLTFL